MSIPLDPIPVRCPQCRHEYRDRGHTPHAVEDDGIEAADFSVCPECGFRVGFDALVPRPGGPWVLDRPFVQAWADGLDD